MLNKKFTVTGDDLIKVHLGALIGVLVLAAFGAGIKECLIVLFNFLFPIDLFIIVVSLVREKKEK